MRADRLAHQAGAATQIQNAVEPRPPCQKQRLKDLRRALVAKLIHQRGLEPVRILIEKGFDESSRHGFGHRNAPRKIKPEPRAKPVLRVDLDDPAPTAARGLGLAQGFLPFGKAEPAGGPIGRQFKRLPHEVDRGGQIPRRGQRLRVIRATVGDQIA